MESKELPGSMILEAVFVFAEEQLKCASRAEWKIKLRQGRQLSSAMVKGKDPGVRLSGSNPTLSTYLQCDYRQVTEPLCALISSSVKED